MALAVLSQPNNPKGEPLIWVATLEGKVAGMVCTVPVKVRTPCGIRLGMWGVDFIVSQPLRGKGIGKQLLQSWLAMPGIAFVRGWSPVSFKVATGVGFRLLWGFPSHRIVLSRLGYLRMLAKKRKRREIASFLKRFPKPLPNVKAVSTEVTKDIPDGWETFWERIAPTYEFTIERDILYLKWRFIEHPSHSYSFVITRKNNEILGIAIARVPSEKGQMGVISDLLVDPADAKGARQLLTETLAFLKSHGVCGAMVDLPLKLAWVTSDLYFVPSEFGMIIHCNEPDLASAGLFDISRWYQGRSDSDEDY